MSIKLCFYSLLSSCLVVTNSAFSFTNNSKLCLIENKGQIHDQNGTERSDIQFKAANDLGSVFIGAGHLHYQLRKEDVNSAMIAESDQEPKETFYSLYRVDMELHGANKNAQVVTEDEQSYFEQYYGAIVSAPQGVARTYRRVVYTNIYPHIDWAIYVKNDRLEYDFIVKPGGNPADIQIEYGGATAIDYSNNNLQIETPFGKINEEKLYAYNATTRTPLPVSYIKRDSLIGFQVGTRRKNATYIIDPTLVWGTYFGGSSSDISTTVNCDGTGNVLMAGYSNSLTNIATSGSHQTSLAGSSDAYLSKFSPTGALLWSTYFGGANFDQAQNITCDNFGHIYLSGLTYSSTGIATTGAYKTTLSNIVADDAFLAKFDLNGSLLWSTYFGSDSSDDGIKVMCDSSGNAYLAGFTTSPSGIATPGAYQSTYGGGNGDCFLAKFSPAGSLLWSTYYGGEGYDNVGGLICKEEVYLTGNTKSTINIATSGAMQTTLHGTSDGFVAKFTPEGILAKATYFGGENDDNVTGITTNKADELYVCGGTSSSTGIASIESHQSTYGGGVTDGFVASFDTALNLRWSTYYGGSAYDLLGNICSDKKGNISVVGQTSSLNNISTLGATQTTLGGTYNAMLAIFDNSGVLHWASYYGGPGDTRGLAIAANDSGDLYMSGKTAATTGIATSGVHQAGYGGSYDAFLAKWGTFAIESIPQLQKKEPLDIFPNPSSGVFAIRRHSKPLSSPVNLTVIRDDGLIVFSCPEPISPSGVDDRIDLQFLLPGTYVLKLTGALNEQSAQIVIIK